MPKLTRGIFIALGFCGLSLIQGCGTKPSGCNPPPGSPAASSSTCTCACPASYNAYVYATGNSGEITTFPFHELGNEPETPTTTSGPASSVGIAEVGNAFLFASDPQAQSGPSIDAWTMSPGNGALTAVSGSPFVLGPSAEPSGLAATTGNLGSTPMFLYVADAGTIDALQVNSETGALSTVPGSPFTSGTNSYLTVDPTNHFVFAADVDPPGGIFAFTIDASTGALTPVPGSPFLLGSSVTGPVQAGEVVVDPLGIFVYVTLPATNQVAGFSINTSSGVLTAVAGSPFAAGAGASAMAATLGEYLYVANPGAGSISGYNINQTTGVLTPLGASPFAAAGVTVLATDGVQEIYASVDGGMTVFNIGVMGELAAAGSPVASSAPTALTYVFSDCCLP
jgi:6-phosphogluconolactonase